MQDIYTYHLLEGPWQPALSLGFPSFWYVTNTATGEKVRIGLAVDGRFPAALAEAKKRNEEVSLSLDSETKTEDDYTLDS